MGARYGGTSAGTYGGAGQIIPNATLSNASFTGSSGFADGTAAIPAIAWISDADGTGTGIYRYAANFVGISINGVAKYAFGSTALNMASTEGFSWSPGAIGGGSDVTIYRANANSILFGAGTSGTVTSRTEINKAVTAFSNAVAKDVFTVTIPNAAHHAVIELEVQGALGAGGAIGAGEAMATNTYKIAIVRTAGVATIATPTAATHAVAVAVAGANTVTATAAVTAMTGAVGATQTFTIQVTITRNAGTSDNHTALLYAKLVNANASGVTIA